VVRIQWYVSTSAFGQPVLIFVDSSVSEQKDTSRIVSSGAYLLFYRRRSDIPLGGPRFKEIIEQFDKPQELSEEGSESGEDQRLVVDSSLPGSSSASNGVGVVHPAAGSAGAATMRAASLLTSGGVALPSQTTIKPADLDDDVLPSYQDALGDDDAAPLITSDAVMNDGILDSIDDEGIDLDTPYVHQPVRQNKGPLIPPSWNFQNLQDIDTASSTDALPSGLNSEFAGGSDIVQNDSSASDGEYERRKDDFENAELDADYRSPTPIPEVSEQDQMAIFDLHSDLLQSKRGTYDHMDTAMALNVPAPNSDDGAEPDAEDIHVEKGEGLTGE
jgi:ubiquitin carboxyl-terminal hydrolase 4/11/15